MSPELVKIPERFPSSAGLYHLWVPRYKCSAPENDRRHDLRSEDIVRPYEGRRLHHSLEESDRVNLGGEGDRDVRITKFAAKPISPALSCALNLCCSTLQRRKYPCSLHPSYQNVKTPHTICMVGNQIRGRTTCNMRLSFNKI